LGDLIISIDIGTSKVCALIGRVNKYSQLEVIGRGMAPCYGLKKGVIVDIDRTAEAIRSALDEAEKAAGVRAGSAYANIHGMHVDVVNNRSELFISNAEREISQRDVDNLIRAVRDIEFSEDKQLIDVIPRQYILDGYDEIVDPVGMIGTRLELDADIVVGKITSVQNIVKSIERAGIQIDGLVAEAFATGEICLTHDERDIGVVLIDVGGGVTDVSVFQGNRLVFYDSIPIGGDHITNDIAIGLRISPSEAEKIKRQYELALTSLIKNDQEISVFDVNENRKKTIKVSELVEIIEARVYEIFSLCRNQIVKSGIMIPPNGSVVLTGAGISYVDGCKQLAGEVFEVPVRVVQAGLIQGVTKPEYVVAAGIIKYVSSIKKVACKTSEIRLSKSAGREPKASFLEKIADFFRKLF